MKPWSKLIPRTRGCGRRSAGLALVSSLTLAGAVAALALAPAGTARSWTTELTSFCPAGGALVAYSNGSLAGGKTLVIKQDGRAWLCWKRVPGDVGRKGFMLTAAQINALRGDLGRIRVGQLGSLPTRPCDHCLPRIDSLSYRGTTLLGSGRQPTMASAAALSRAEAMLDLMAERQIAGT